MFHLAKHLFFYYVVNNSYAVFDNFNERRRLEKMRSDYAVFRYPGGFQNDFVKGPFKFVCNVYSKFCNGKHSLQDALDEYDQIRFGFQTFPFSKKRLVVDWIHNQLANQPTVVNAVFFAHVIQHFDMRLLHKTKDNHPLLKDLLEDDLALQFLGLLLQCKKEELLQLVPDAKNFVAFLIRDLRGGASLNMFIQFSFIFGGKFLKSFTDFKDVKWSDSPEDNLKLAEEIKGIVADMSVADRDQLLDFVVQKSPSFSFLWWLYDILLDAFPSYVNAIFKSTCEYLLTSRHQGKLMSVFDKSSWEAVPEKLKPIFADPFLKVLVEQLKRKKWSLNYQEEDAVISFFTDEMIFSNTNAKETIIEASKVPEMQRVVTSILQSPNISKHWIETDEEIKSEVYDSLIKHAFLPRNNPEIAKKSQVLCSLLALNEVYRTLEVCPCDKMKDKAAEKCNLSLGATDFAEITKEFEQIEKLHPDVEKVYYGCLRRSIDREIKRDNNHANVIELLNKLSEDGKKQKTKLIIAR